MQILNNLFGEQLNRYGRALDRTSQRQSLLANNLANANVPGYKRKDMDFSIALNGATETAGGAIDAVFGGGKGSTGSSGNQGDVRMDGNSVDIEREVMSITETEYHYQMLTEMTSGFFSGLKNVIREGR